MQAVILAAGKSTRTYPLTVTRPKPLLKLANKTLLEYNLDNLNNIVSEAIIVVGYKKNMIEDYFGNKYKNIRIRYVEQKEQLGTAHALSVAEPCIKDRFILLMGDDIYSLENIKECIKYKYSITTARVKNPENFGVIIEKNGIFIDVIEKPQKFISDLVSIALFSFDKKIFRFIKKIKKSERNEFELPDAIKLLSQEEKIIIIKAKEWCPIVYSWDLLKFDSKIRKGKNNIRKNTKIYGKVITSSIGSNCIVKGDVENSIIMDNAIIDRGSFIGDSIVGENVYFKGTIIAKNDAYSVIKDKKIKAGRLGAIIGDNCKLMNVIINPGCKIWPNTEIKNKKIENDVL